MSEPMFYLWVYLTIGTVWMCLDIKVIKKESDDIQPGLFPMVFIVLILIWPFSIPDYITRFIKFIRGK